MVAEVQTIIDATYRVIERTGTIDPTMRDILAEAKLSTPAFYRHFRSKDELFVVLLDDGLRRLAATIERRLAREATGAGRLKAWIGAVMDQAVVPSAAARTRPFMAGIDRMTERYPREQRVSEQLLIDQLVGMITFSEDLVSVDVSGDARAVYHLTFGALAWHLRAMVTPSDEDVEQLVSFALRAFN